MENLSQKDTLVRIDSTVEQLDALRLKGLGDFQNNRLVKNEILIREKKRMEAKHGATHPKVLETQTKLTYQKEMAVGVEIEREKAAIKSEPFERNAWRLHGKVYEKDLKPVVGVTVYFSSERKDWIEELGSYCTDETGYFTLTLKDEIIDKLKGNKIFVSVSDKNKKVLIIHQKPVLITKGSIDYIEICLNKDGCVPPPTDKDPRDPKVPPTPNPDKKPPITGGETKPIKPEKPDTKPPVTGGETKPVNPLTGGETKPINPIIRGGGNRPEK